ncbi:hypothetical protein Salat_1429100 [Sesamum alatum]|uniref:Retrotransposon Copia-like N-terminal domain-containing protein n=1 Tax=Sesamum alatum TaxID=300844 RepID=A0AAE2CLI7_9LAMI|nr:hypothetical protein Salat_1429100 [Sesamum alatum]
MLLVSTPLTPQNYLAWNRSVRIVLRAKMKLGFLTGSTVKPALDSPEYELWEPDAPRSSLPDSVGDVGPSSSCDSSDHHHRDQPPAAALEDNSPIQFGTILQRSTRTHTHNQLG